MKPYSCHLLSVIVMVTFTACNCQPDIGIVRDLEKAGLKGPVRSVLWETQDITVSSERSSKQKWKQDVYDERSNLVRTEIFPAYSGTHTVKTYEHNRWGQRIKTSHFNAKGFLESVFLQHYASHGRLQKEKYLDAQGQSIRQWIYKWDREKNMDAVSVYQADGTLSGHAEWYYDGRGRVIRKTSVTIECLYSYDGQGTITRSEQRQLNNHGEWDRFVTYYQDWEKPIKEEDIEWSDSGIRTVVKEYQYTTGTEGNWIEQREIQLPLEFLLDDINETGHASKEKTITRIVSRTIDYYPN